MDQYLCLYTYMNSCIIPVSLISLFIFLIDGYVPIVFYSIGTDHYFSTAYREHVLLYRIVDTR